MTRAATLALLAITGAVVVAALVIGAVLRMVQQWKGEGWK